MTRGIESHTLERLRISFDWFNGKLHNEERKKEKPLKNEEKRKQKDAHPLNMIACIIERTGWATEIIRNRIISNLKERENRKSLTRQNFFVCD
jgi:hypothetical protein